MSKTDKLSPIGEFASYYANNSLLQALTVSLGGGQLNSLLGIRAKEIATDRIRTFFEALENGKIELTPEIIQSEEFIHRYVITAKAVVETYKREKIRRFAQIFQSSFQKNNAVDTNEYEECLRIIDGMSDREYLLLCLLERFEKFNPYNEGLPEKNSYVDPQEHKDSARAELFWDRFLDTASGEFNVHKTQVEDMLEGLRRTGCYKSLGPRSFINMTHYTGKLTLTWFRIRELINDTRHTNN